VSCNVIVDEQRSDSQKRSTVVTWDDLNVKSFSRRNGLPLKGLNGEKPEEFLPLAIITAPIARTALINVLPIPQLHYDAGHTPR